MGSSGKVIHKSEQQKKGDVGKHVNREMCIKQFNTSFVAATAICIWKSHREHCKLVVVHSDTVCISCPRVQSPPPPHTTYVVFYTTYIFKKKKKKRKPALPVCSSFAWPAPGCPVPDPAQEGYYWPGGASGWGKAKTVMGGCRLTGRHPRPEENKQLMRGIKADECNIKHYTLTMLIICV